MPSAAALRFQIETALQNRIPGALTPRPRVTRDVATTGVPELDAVLEGGLPIGAISELVGPQSSGRTTLAQATLAEMTQAGKTVAWVDACDALDPESAAAAGINLTRQLWVRCGQDLSKAGAVPPQQNARTGAALLVEGSHTPAPGGGCGSPHPRGEARGMSQAVDAFLQPDTFARNLPPRPHYNVGRKDRTIGTPGAPNRKLMGPQSLDRTPQDPRPIPRRAQDREEQIPSDRQPSRRQILHASKMGNEVRSPSLGAAQIANTALAAKNRPQARHWSDNTNNEHGRAFQTPPNAIAAGLPRFRELESRAQGQSDRLTPLSQKPPLAQLGGANAPTEAGVSQNSSPKTGQAGTPAQQGRQVVAMPAVTAESKTAQTLKSAHSLAGERPGNLTEAASPLWRALDQALRATDLLLAAGGFSAVVLDLGSIPPEFAWRIPLATWFRFRAAADRACTVLLLLTQHPCARSSAELVLRLSAVEPRSATTVLTGARFRIAIDRRRFETQPTPVATPDPSTPPNKLHLVPARKQPQREATWHRAAAWTGTEANSARGGHPA